MTDNNSRDLLQAYAAAAAHKNDSKQAAEQYANLLQQVGTIIAYSVLKKCLDPQRAHAMQSGEASNSGLSAAMQALRRGLAADNACLQNASYADNNSSRLMYDKQGNLCRKVTDSELNTAAAKLADTALSDGIDLRQEAILALLEEEAKADLTNADWLQAVRIENRLVKHVYIKSGNKTRGEAKEVETMPIVECYRAVRRYIDQNGHISVNPRNGYLYLEELADVDGNEETIYRRLPKYADLAGAPARDLNGAASVYSSASACRQVVEDMDLLTAALDLTTKQAAVLQKRLQGLSYREIAESQHVTFQAIAKTVKKIAEKAIAAGLAPNSALVSEHLQNLANLDK